MKNAALSICLLCWISAPVLGQSDEVGAVRWPATHPVLQRKVSLSTDSLAKAAAAMARQSRVNFLIDERAFEEIGFDVYGELPLTVEDATVSHVLDRLALEEITFQLNDDFIRLTTLDAAEESPVSRLYRVGAIVRVGGSDDSTFMDHHTLIDLIQTVIDPDTWESLGGPSGIGVVGDMIAISTLDRTHSKILRLIKTLQKARHVKPEEARDTPVLRIVSVEDEATDRTLERIDIDRLTVRDEGEKSIPLNHWAEQISKQLETPVWLNVDSLNEIGLTASDRVPVLRGPLPARLMLTESLRGQDLTFSVMDQTVVIESHESAEMRQSCAVYPVSDLVPVSQYVGDPPILVEPYIDGSGYTLHGFRLIEGIQQPSGQLSMQRLLELIKSMVQPDSWEELGGPATIAPYHHGGCLVIGATDSIHQGVKELLQDLRKGRAMSRKPAPITGDEYVTVAFELKTDARPELDPEDLARRGVDPTSWDKPQARLNRFGDLLVIRNQIKTISRLSNLLQRLDLLKPVPPRALQGGFF